MSVQFYHGLEICVITLYVTWAHGLIEVQRPHTALQYNLRILDRSWINRLLMLQPIGVFHESEVKEATGTIFLGAVWSLFARVKNIRLTYGAAFDQQHISGLSLFILL